MSEKGDSKLFRCLILMLALSAVAGSPAARAQQSAEDLAKKLANPVASLISVPFQLNYDRDIGPVEGGKRWTLNVQPVIPIELNRDWNIISRTIVPLIDQKDIVPGAGSQSGTGDIVQSLFFSPKKPTAGGLIWGWDRCSCSRPPATICSARKNGASDRPASF